MYCDWPILGRCCFCLPLRKGVLVFGTINIVFSAFMIGVYSYAENKNQSYALLYHGPASSIAPPAFCIALYCTELVFNVVLVYGAYIKSTPCIRVYYYFAITTTLAGVALQILEITSSGGFFIEMFLFIFAGLCIQLYILVLVSSLLKKLQTDGPHAYENQLQQIVTGDTKIGPNGIYNNSTVEPIATN